MNGLQTIKRSWIEEYVPKTKHTTAIEQDKHKKEEGEGDSKGGWFHG